MTPLQWNQQFAEQGFVYCPSFLCMDQVQGVIAELERVIRDVVPQMPAEHVFYEDKSSQTSLKQLQQLNEHDPYFSALLNEGPVRQLAEALLGHSVTPRNLQYFNKPPNSGLPTPAHQDGFYFKLAPCRAITAWLALEAVDEENGCVRYVSGSHRGGMRPHGKTGTLGFSQGILDFPQPSDLSHEVPCPAQAGDLLAHDAMTIHRADGNSSSSRTRRALGFIYYDDRAAEDTVAWQTYQDELKAELERDGKI